MSWFGLLYDTYLQKLCLLFLKATAAVKYKNIRSNNNNNNVLMNCAYI